MSGFTVYLSGFLLGISPHVVGHEKELALLNMFPGVQMVAIIDGHYNVSQLYPFARSRIERKWEGWKGK